MLDELIKMGNIIDYGEFYQLANWRFFSGNNESYIVLLSTEVHRIAETYLENIDNSINENKKLHRIFYSNQINPNSFYILNDDMKNYFKIVRKKIYEILISHEENVPRGTYPTFGVSVFTFGPDHNIDYSSEG